LELVHRIIGRRSGIAHLARDLALLGPDALIPV